MTKENPFTTYGHPKDDDYKEEELTEKEALEEVKKLKEERPK